MRKLMLVLIAFIAVVTFIRAFEKTETEVPVLSGTLPAVSPIQNSLVQDIE